MSKQLAVFDTRGAREHNRVRGTDHADLERRYQIMQCIVQGCPGDMEERRIVHTFVREGKPIVIEDLPALVCPICGYTVLDVRVLDTLFALDPETDTSVSHAPVFRLSRDPVAAGVE